MTPAFGKVIAMSTPLSADLASQLQGEPMQQIAQQLGIGHAEANSAIAAALPLLLSALGHNTSQPLGAQALYGALQKDHAGLDLGSVLGAVLGGGGQGGQILDHIFGNSQPRAGQVLGQATGIGNDKAAMLLRWLAPIVMAYLAKRMFDNSQGAAAATTPTATAPTPASASAPEGSSPQILGEVLGQESAHAQQHGGLLDAVLGRNSDGNLDLSDLLKVGSSVLGGLGRA